MYLPAHIFFERAASKWPGDRIFLKILAGTPARRNF
jgi:hypothetical protein